MATALFNNTTLYPTITVSMGVTTSSTGIALWGGSPGSLFNTATWGPDTSFIDITSYVRSLSTTRGRSRETDKVGTGSLQLTLSNGDSRFSPSNLSGPYVNSGISQIRPGVVFKVEATWAGVTYPVFYGTADEWQDSYPAMGRDGITTVTVYDALSTLASFDGLAQGFLGAGERAGARMARIATNAAFTGPLVLDTGMNTMQATTLDSNALTELQLTADSDGGVVFAGADGSLTFHDGNAPYGHARSNTSQFTFGPGSTEVNYEAVQPTYDSTLIYNTITYQRTGGTAYTTTAQDSISLYRKQSSLVKTGLVCSTDVQVGILAEQTLTKYRDAEYRIKSLTVQGAANPTVSWPKVLGAILCDRVTAKVTAPGSVNITAQLFIDGISHTIDSRSGWSTTFTFASAATSPDASRFGVFDTSLWDTGVWAV